MIDHSRLSSVKCAREPPITGTRRSARSSARAQPCEDRGIRDMQVGFEHPDPRDRGHCVQPCERAGQLVECRVGRRDHSDVERAARPCGAVQRGAPVRRAQVEFDEHGCGPWASAVSGAGSGPVAAPSDDLGHRAADLEAHEIRVRRLDRRRRFLHADPHALAHPLVGGDRIGEREGERATVGLVGGIRPVPLIFHLEHVALESHRHVEPRSRHDNAAMSKTGWCGLSARGKCVPAVEPSECVTRRLSPATAGGCSTTSPVRFVANSAADSRSAITTRRSPRASTRTTPRKLDPSASERTCSVSVASERLTRSTTRSTVSQLRSRTTARTDRSTVRPSYRMSANSSPRTCRLHGPDVQSLNIGRAPRS